MTLRLVHVLILIAACLHGAAHAQPQPQPQPQPKEAASLRPCDRPVRFAAAWFAAPEVDRGKTVAELSSAGPGSRGGGAMQLGHVVVETKLTVVPQVACRGVLVRLDYAKPVLRVAREFAPGTCAHARVMAHELTHVRLHRQIAQRFRELDYPWGAATGSAAILAYAKQELDRLMRAQELFDSPEEYGRNQTACGGEITRLMAGKAKPG